MPSARRLQKERPDFLFDCALRSLQTDAVLCDVAVALLLDLGARSVRKEESSSSSGPHNGVFQPMLRRMTMPAHSGLSA